MKTSGPKKLISTSRILPQRDPDVLETRTGGGCLSLFGLPFFLAGLFIMQMPLHLLPVKNSDDMPALFFIMIGFLFTAIGGALVFGRAGLILDRRTGAAIKWFGLFLPMWRKQIPLDTLKSVSLRKEVGDSDSPDTYPVKLAGEAGQKSLFVTNPTDYGQARRDAEQVAKFMGLPVADTSTGKKVVRQASELDESLRDRARRSRETVSSLPEPPFDMRTKVSETGDGVVLEIPGPRMGAQHYVALGGALLVSAFAASIFFGILDPSDLTWPPSTREAIIGAVVIIIFVAGPLIAALTHIRRDTHSLTSVIATPDLLRVEQRIKGKVRYSEIPGEELEELTLPTLQDAATVMNEQQTGKPHGEMIGDTGVIRMSDGRPMPGILVSLLKMAPSPGIVARSDKATITFGAGLSEPELQYLHALILQTMTK